MSALHAQGKSYLPSHVCYPNSDRPVTVLFLNFGWYAAGFVTGMAEHMRQVRERVVDGCRQRHRRRGAMVEPARHGQLPLRRGAARLPLAFSTGAGARCFGAGALAIAGAHHLVELRLLAGVDRFQSIRLADGRLSLVALGRRVGLGMRERFFQRRDAPFSEFQVRRQAALFLLQCLPLLRGFLKQLLGRAFVTLLDGRQAFRVGLFEGGDVRARRLPFRLDRILAFPQRCQLRIGGGQFFPEHVHAQVRFGQGRLRGLDGLPGLGLELGDIIELDRHCGMPQLPHLFGNLGRHVGQREVG